MFRSYKSWEQLPLSSISSTFSTPTSLYCLFGFAALVAISTASHSTHHNSLLINSITMTKARFFKAMERKGDRLTQLEKQGKKKVVKPTKPKSEGLLPYDQYILMAYSPANACFRGSYSAKPPPQSPRRRHPTQPKPRRPTPRERQAAPTLHE